MMEESNEPNQRYAGMTTNERLFVAGLLDKFDRATSQRNKQIMIQLLASVELGDEAESITDTLLSNPKKYGY